MGAVAELYRELLEYVQLFLRSVEAMQEFYDPGSRANRFRGTSTSGKGETLAELIGEFSIFVDPRYRPVWKWVGTVGEHEPPGPDEYDPADIIDGEGGWESSIPFWWVDRDAAMKLEAAAQKMDAAIGRANKALGPGRDLGSLASRIRAGMPIWRESQVPWEFYWTDLQRILQKVRIAVGEAGDDLHSPAIPDWLVESEAIAHGTLGARASAKGPLSDPGWPKVDRMVKKAQWQLTGGSTPEDFQAVGLLCREILISLAQAVYDPVRHKAGHESTLSVTDAKGMLDAYFSVELRGRKMEGRRRMAKAAVDQANELQHKRTATRGDATSSLKATEAVIDQVAVVAGREET